MKKLVTQANYTHHCAKFYQACNTKEIAVKYGETKEENKGIQI